MLSVKRTFLLILLLISFSVVRAQTPLRISQFNPTPDSVSLGTSFSFEAIIQNTDSFTTFNGRIGILYTINGIFHSMDSTSGLAYDTALSITNIFPLDTIRKSITVNVTSPRFQTGPSVVVIWPIASNAVAEDSLVLNINVLPAVGVPQIDSHPVKVFVSNDNIIINADTFVVIKQVRVFDVMGRGIMNDLNPSRRIPLPETNRGIYVAEIIYNNDKRKTIRFFR